MKREKYIDIAKGIAIISVVSGHILIYNIYGFNDVWNESPLVKFIYSFHMPLFIFFSGLVASIPNSLSQAYKDLFKRFKTLLIPFFIIGGIYSFTITQNLSFLLDKMKFGYWYFLVLFYCYILNYIGINLTTDYKKLLLPIQICLMIIAWKTITHISTYTPINIQNILSINLFIAYYPYYLIGSLIKRFNLHRVLFNNTYIFIVSIILWSQKDLIQFPYSNYITTSSTIFAMMFICYKIEERTTYSSRILNYIGLNTLYIYCFHYFILQVMNVDFIHQWINPIDSSILFDLLLCIIPTSFAILFSLFIKCIIKDSIITKLIFNK